MKIRTSLIVILSISTFVLVWLQLGTLNEIKSSGIMNRYVDASNEIVETIADGEMETEVVEYEALEDINYESMHMSVNEVNNEVKNKEKTKKLKCDDNNNVKIVITNSNGGIYHENLKLKSSGIITLYYGENFQNIRTFSKKVTINSKEYFGKNKKIKITSDKKIVIEGLSKVAFDGSFFIHRESKGFVAVNDIQIEKYLYGVVSSEMPSYFEMEALKAQAVCARTYTYAQMENSTYEKYGAIMDDTVSYQAYGNTKITKKVKKAVNSTKNQVLTANGKLINAFYFSTSCGYTTDSSIWGNKEYNYLKSKYVSQGDNSIDVATKDYFNRFIKKISEDYEKECAFYRWNITIKSNTIKNKISEVKNVDIGDVREIKVLERGAGGIVAKIEITGEKDTVVITNQNEVRKVFSPDGHKLQLNDGSVRTNMTSLPSAFFVIDKINDSEYKLTGGGFGHGSGMSQYGAHEMAKKGEKYDDILSFFYTGVTCDQIYTQ